MLGLAFIFFGAAATRVPRLPPPIGYLMALSGLAYLAQGWIIGSSGFSSANSTPTLTAIASIVAWSVCLLFAAFLARSSHPARRATDSAEL